MKGVSHSIHAKLNNIGDVRQEAIISEQANKTTQQAS